MTAGAVLAVRFRGASVWMRLPGIPCFLRDGECGFRVLSVLGGRRMRVLRAPSGFGTFPVPDMVSTHLCFRLSRFLIRVPGASFGMFPVWDTVSVLRCFRSAAGYSSRGGVFAVRKQAGCEFINPSFSWATLLCGQIAPANQGGFAVSSRFALQSGRGNYSSRGHITRRPPAWHSICNGNSAPFCPSTSVGSLTVETMSSAFTRRWRTILGLPPIR